MSKSHDVFVRQKKEIQKFNQFIKNINNESYQIATNFFHFFLKKN